MSPREDLRRAVETLADERVARARIVVKEVPPGGQPRPLPEHLRRFDSGRTQPDWAEAVRRSRAEH